MKYISIKKVMVFTLLIGMSAVFSEETPLAIIKSSRGRGLQYNQDRTSSQFLKPFNTVLLNGDVETSEGQTATFRLFLAQGQFVMYANTSFKIMPLKYRDSSFYALTLSTGSLDLNFSREAGTKYLLNTDNTVVQSKGARWFTTSDNGAVTKLVVINGTINVYNRPKDMSANIPKGKTCYSDKDGLRIVATVAEDLNLFRQSIIEVDFVDPVSNQTKTLELEYESNF